MTPSREGNRRPHRQMFVRVMTALVRGTLYREAPGEIAMIVGRIGLSRPPHNATGDRLTVLKRRKWAPQILRRLIGRTFLSIACSAAE